MKQTAATTSTHPAATTFAVRENFFSLFVPRFATPSCILSMKRLVKTNIPAAAAISDRQESIVAASFVPSDHSATAFESCRALSDCPRTTREVSETIYYSPRTIAEFSTAPCDRPETVVESCLAISDRPRTIIEPWQTHYDYRETVVEGCYALCDRPRATNNS